MTQEVNVSDLKQLIETVDRPFHYHMAQTPLVRFVVNLLYTVVHKKRDTFIFSITLANIDGFS